MGKMHVEICKDMANVFYVNAFSHFLGSDKAFENVSVLRKSWSLQIRNRVPFQINRTSLKTILSESGCLAKAVS